MTVILITLAVAGYCTVITAASILIGKMIALINPADDPANDIANQRPPGRPSPPLSG